MEKMHYANLFAEVFQDINTVYCLYGFKISLFCIQIYIVFLFYLKGCLLLFSIAFIIYK